MARKTISPQKDITDAWYNFIYVAGDDIKFPEKNSNLLMRMLQKRYACMDQPINKLWLIIKYLQTQHMNSKNTSKHQKHSQWVANLKGLIYQKNVVVWLDACLFTSAHVSTITYQLIKHKSHDTR